jgi:uncharacterized membrane protein YbhN (UPF0104 family)
VQFIVGIAIFVALIRFAGAESTFKTLVGCRIIPAVYAFFFIIINMFVGAVGVTIIGRKFNSNLSWRDGIQGYLIVSVLSSFVPGKLADFSLPYFWRRNLAIHQTSSIVVIDKLITLFWIVSLSIIGGTLFFEWCKAYHVVVAIGVFLSAVIFYVVKKKLAHRYATYLPSNLYRLFSGMKESFLYSLQYARYELMANAFLTGLRMLISGVVLVLLLASVHENVHVLPMTVLNAVSQFSTLIPITISGIGIMESIWIAGLHKDNISADSVIAAAILGRIMVLVMSLIFGATLFRMKK